MRKLKRDRRRLAVLAVAAVVLAFSAVSAFASPSRSVRIGDDYFSATRLTVGRGTKVTWNWTGVLRHNVTVMSGPSRFHSRTQVRGTFDHTFSRAGTYHLECTIHPFMTMTVVVK
jgi:plastocyanin